MDEAYGLPSKDIGLHSIRASGAMAMYLNGVPVYTIMLLGRWSSDAFLRYIRKQVTEFSNNHRGSIHFGRSLACLLRIVVEIKLDAGQL